MQNHARDGWEGLTPGGIVEERIRVGEIALHVARLGSGPPVILLHGFPELWLAWREIMPSIAARGRTAVAPDMRGFHLSDKPIGIEHYRLSELAGDVVGLLDALGCERAPIVGHDWGGVVGWAVAALHPERVERLVILNAPHPTHMREVLMRSPAQLRKSFYVGVFQLPELPERFIKRRDSLARIFREWSIRKEHWDDATIDAYTRAMNVPGAATATLSYYRAALRVPTSLPRVVHPPTTIIWGERDRALGRELLEGLESKVRDLSVHPIADAGHWVAQDQPELVAALIQRAIEVPPSAPRGPSDALEEREIRAGGRRLFYRERPGTGSEVVLMLHGIPTSSVLYRNVMGAIDRSARVIALDLPGFGRSEKDPRKSHGFHALGAVVGAFLREVAPDRRVTLVVHDVGGPVGLSWASRHPEHLDGLLILDTTVFPRHFRPPAAALAGALLPGLARVAIATAAGPDVIERTMQREIARSIDRASLAEYAAPYRDPDARACLARVFTEYRSGAGELRKIRERLPRIATPTTVLFGARDPFCPPPNAWAFTRKIPGARLRILRDAGHFIPEDAPLEVAAEINALLCGRAGSS